MICFEACFYIFLCGSYFLGFYLFIGSSYILAGGYYLLIYSLGGYLAIRILFCNGILGGYASGFFS